MATATATKTKNSKDINGVVLIDAFRKDLGGLDWFIDLLINLRQQQSLGYHITDLILKEGSDILVGVLKHFFPVRLSQAVGLDKITRNMIKELAEKILATKLSLFDLTYNYEKIKHNAKEKIERITSGKPIKFSLSVEVLGSMRFIFSIDNSGPILNVRMLDFSVPTMEETRMPQAYVEWLDSLLEPVKLKVPFSGMEMLSRRFRRGGLIVHCGPTGSGKTTSIASQIRYVSEKISGLVITYENPVEYVYINHPNVMQFELGQHIEEHEIYHHFLRMSAEACLVGEVKTSEEIFRVVDLASRGHVVWTTVHANSVEECLYLLKEHMKDNLPLLLSSLLAITSQRLVLVSGRIVPVYQSLLFWRHEKEHEVLQTLKKQIESGTSMQDLSNFIRNRMQTLKEEGLFLA